MGLDDGSIGFDSSGSRGCTVARFFSVARVSIPHPLGVAREEPITFHYLIGGSGKDDGELGLPLGRHCLPSSKKLELWS